jgi:rSAM/selenodomain-associated transferase 2
MLTSIIIPTLNEAASIARVVENAAALPGDKEIIVVDGGSTDGTVEIAGERAVVISSTKGRAAQMNAGAKLAKGDVLLFLHADTLLPTGALKAVEQSLSCPEVIGGRFRVNLNNPGWRYRMIGWSINVRDSIVGGFTGDQAIFVRREIFNSMGGYAPMDLMEDLDFGRRMRRMGKATRLEEYVTTSARRWEKGGVLRTVFIMGALRTLYYLNLPATRPQRWYGDAR